ncbi:MAG: class I SAM-dependent methyltransferase [Patescibacteria group bacterium]|nr:class I SAM-dependent methyltransferase [Patescibacteria group bacterium]
MKKRKLLLDVGCGEARCCIDFAKQGFDVIGVEKDPDVFERAKASVDKSEEKKFITLLKRDIRKVKLNKRFDGILFNHVLMFMSKKDALGLIKKYYESLNRGGEMLVRMLMFDDPVAVSFREKNRKDVFFPKQKEMKEIEGLYNGKLEFLSRKEKAHDGYNCDHTHFIGVLKITR